MNNKENKFAKSTTSKISNFLWLNVISDIVIKYQVELDEICLARGF
jgi:hypothetical protein